MCDNRHYISEVPLSLNSVRKRMEAFLSSNGLRLATLERYVVISRDEDGDEIIAGGGLDGNVIKCVAVSEAARSEGLMNILVSRLIAIAHEEGYVSVKAFTKPALEIIAVPCWSSCITGMSSSSLSLRSISKHSGALMSSRLIPPKVGAMAFTA